MASDRKIAEGMEHIRQAEKCMKTGVFKWKPDLDGAVSEFGKAALAFRTAKASEQAIDCYLKCSELQQRMGSAFHAAKSLESAALICRDTKDLDKAADLVEQAANLYLEHGTVDTAAIALDRAAKMIEYDRPERAIQLFCRACDVSEGEDRPRQCAEMVGKAARVQLRLRKLEDAAATLQRELDYYAQVDNGGVINKLVLGVVLVQLHRQDYVAASLAFKAALSSYSGFAASEEAGPIEALLEAYDQGDQDAADQVTRSPLFKFMENEFTKLARDLRVPGGRKKSSKPTGSSEVTSSGDAGEEEDDEYEGGLL